LQVKENFMRSLPCGNGGWKKRRMPLEAALLFFLALCSLPFTLYAAKIYPSAGSTSATFLKIGVGARAVAMGGAYTAISGDPYALFWNPAGLAVVEDKTLVFTHNEYFAGLSQEYMGYNFPGSGIRFFPGRLKNGVMGLSMNYLYTGKDLERRSGDYESDPLNPISPMEGEFRAYDLALSLGYGFNYSRDLKIGAALKFIRQSIDTESGSSAALDLGMLYDFDLFGRGVTAGFAAQNLGPGIKFIDKRFPLPLTFKAGLSRRLYEKSLLMSLDVSKPIDNYPSVAVGLEQQLGGKLFLRSGYRYRQHGNESGGWSGFSMGFGFVSGRFSFDYALSPFGDLGNTHRLSAALRFLAPKAPVLKERGEVVPAANALSSANTLALSFEQKPLVVSQRGITYLVKASAAGAGADAAGSSPAGDQASDGIPAQGRERQAAPEPFFENGSIVSLAFITLMHGEGRAAVTLAEGSLPKTLLEKFPVPSGPLKAWQLLSMSGGLNGNIKFVFSLVKDPPAGEPVLYYLVKGGWEKTEARTVSCGEKNRFYSASAPFSTHYALVVK